MIFFGRILSLTQLPAIGPLPFPAGLPRLCYCLRLRFARPHLPATARHLSFARTEPPRLAAKMPTSLKEFETVFPQLVFTFHTTALAPSRPTRTSSRRAKATASAFPRAVLRPARPHASSSWPERECCKSRLWPCAVPKRGPAPNCHVAFDVGSSIPSETSLRDVKRNVLQK